MALNLQHLHHQENDQNYIASTAGFISLFYLKEIIHNIQ